MIKKNISSKILTIGPDYRYPSGGIAKLLNSYSKYFESFNFITTLRVPLLHKENILQKIYRFFKAVIQCFYILTTQKIEIVHIHTASGITFYRESIFVLLAYLFKKNIFIHMHSGILDEFYENHPKYHHFILKKVTLIITVANIWKDFLLSKGYKNVITIGNPIDMPLSIPKQPSGELQLLFLGALCDNKGIYDILRMLNKYKKELEGKIFLYVGGNGEVTRFLDFIHNYKLESMVQYVGWVTSIEKSKLLSQSDIYLQPSYKEALGIAILEAMSYRLTIIASCTGGIPEIVNHGTNGFLISPGDIDQMYEYINKFLEKKTLLPEMGEKGYQISCNYFPIAIEKQLEKTYMEYLL